MTNEKREETLTLNYPSELPICAHRSEILSHLKKHPVIIVCGDTGSGKTTQLPKMALELGFGAKGRRIACTQPRRLAAVTVAERVAAELKSPIGEVVGYQHRYQKLVSETTRVKFMTDGVLLAETRHDPLLTAYDVIIVDEAHERSLNVDFLLGILKRILAKRRDLKVIVSSATLDTEKFSAFFSNAPTILVPGRLFPIEMIYHPPADGEERDLPREVASALNLVPPGDDTLVFLPGERDIRETADHLARVPSLRGDDILPLLASLPAAEQKRAFARSSKRRIILATNVAETSVTIPGIRAVIDSGLARISRYIHRTQVQRLQIESISQASARQRAGRCGRVGPGTCIRLYDEDDFNSREAFTPPEVLRASLAGVILALLDLRLGAIEKFPFIDPPKPTMIREGLRELIELGAIHHDATGEVALTRAGRQLAQIPVEPRLARMLLTASRLATLPSVIPIVAAMSCDDPMRRPIDEREKADQAHAPFRVAGSDFLGILKLWNWWDEQTKTHSQTALRKLATKTYLSFPKMREWRELVRQLTELAKRLKLDITNDNGGPDALHRALVSGLLARLGKLHPEDLDYRGAHGIRFDVHPASVLGKRGGRAAREKPEWIVSGELVDTARLFARTAAKIDPAWIEDLAGTLCRHSYRDPMWDKESGFVRATEQVTLYGLVIVPSRRRDYSRIDPACARQLFLLHGLVFGEFPNPPPEVRANNKVIAEIKKRAEQMRQPELFMIDELQEFFDQVVPKEINNARDLRNWLYKASKGEKKKFTLSLSPKPSPLNPNLSFPTSIHIGNARLSLSYRYTPNDPEQDGITCTVKKSEANALRQWRHDWLVPGALPRKVHYLLNVLPASLRRVLSPLADTVTMILPLLKQDDSLESELRRRIRERFGIKIPADAWDNVRLPSYLLVRFRIRNDEDGKMLSVSRDLETALREAGIAPPKPIIKEVPLSKELIRTGKEIETTIRELLWKAEALPEDIYDDIETQIAHLTYDGYLRTVPSERLMRYPKYLEAIRRRIDRARVNPASDRSKMERFAPFWEQYTEAITQKTVRIVNRPALIDYRWMLEEYRISLFAQELKTLTPVSPTRLEIKWLEATEE